MKSSEVVISIASLQPCHINCAKDNLGDLNGFQSTVLAPLVLKIISVYIETLFCASEPVAPLFLGSNHITGTK